MSWALSANNIPFYTNILQIGETSIEVLYTGFGADAASVVVDIDGQMMVLDHPATSLFALKVGATTLDLQPTLVNGNRWWASDGAIVHVVYRAYGGGWVYSTALGAGWPPVEWYDEENETWHGDAYYYSSDLPEFFGGSANFEARGSIHGDADIVVETSDPPRWESDTVLGVYEPVSGATGTRAVGNPEWRNFVKGSMVRSNSPDTLGRYKYYLGGQAIQWNAYASAYVLGVYGSAAGWHEMAEPPEPGATATLVFAFPPEADPVPEGADIVLPWRRWTSGDGSGEVAKYYYADFARML